MQVAATNAASYAQSKAIQCKLVSIKLTRVTAGADFAFTFGGGVGAGCFIFASEGA